MSEEVSEVEEIQEEYRPATIFDAHALFEEVPGGFDAVRIPLDGSLQADLSWNDVRQAAGKYVSKGLRLFWDLDLGLFEKLPFSVEHQSQFLSLTLSIKHFQESLWSHFREQTVGLCLYRGPVDFNQKITVDVAGEYLGLLVDRIPDSLPCFVLLDAQSVKSPLALAQHLTKERFPRIHLGVRGGRGLGGELGWNDKKLSMGVLARELSDNGIEKEIRTAVCLPLMARQASLNMVPLEEALIDLERSSIPFRVIPEPLLTLEWGGLDRLIVLSKGVSPQGHRMLQGFCAAGGVVEYVG